MTALSELTSLTPSQLQFCIAVIFFAGMVRGFSGFALSAVIMASAVVILPPVELIPVCIILEGVAGVMMFRGGIRDADMSVVWGLVIGSTIGVPIGLYFTTTVPVELSTMIALIIVLTLAGAQLMRLSPTFLATRPGLYGSGLAAGIVTGLASVGGMVVALYVLARHAPAKTIRASLVMFLFIGMATSILYLLAFGLMDAQALTRGMVFAPVVIAGVVLGSWIFRPSLEQFYRKFCLTLLIVLACVGLVRQLIW